MDDGSWVMGHGSWVIGYGFGVMGFASSVMGYGLWIKHLITYRDVVEVGESRSHSITR